MRKSPSNDAGSQPDKPSNRSMTKREAAIARLAREQAREVSLDARRRAGPSPV